MTEVKERTKTVTQSKAKQKEKPKTNQNNSGMLLLGGLVAGALALTAVEPAKEKPIKKPFEHIAIGGGLDRNDGSGVVTLSLTYTGYNSDGPCNKYKSSVISVNVQEDYKAAVKHAVKTHLYVLKNYHEFYHKYPDTWTEEDKLEIREMIQCGEELEHHIDHHIKLLEEATREEWLMQRYPIYDSSIGANPITFGQNEHVRISLRCTVDNEAETDTLQKSFIHDIDLGVPTGKFKDMPRAEIHRKLRDTLWEKAGYIRDSIKESALCDDFSDRELAIRYHFEDEFVTNIDELVEELTEKIIKQNKIKYQIDIANPLRQNLIDYGWKNITVIFGDGNKYNFSSGNTATPDMKGMTCPEPKVAFRTDSSHSFYTFEECAATLERWLSHLVSYPKEQIKELSIDIACDLYSTHADWKK